jgi:hypothetical protein
MASLQAVAVTDASRSWSHYWQHARLRVDA